MTKRRKNILIAIVVFAVILAIVLIGCAIELSGHVVNIKRIDENGTLYYAEYSDDYSKGLIRLGIGLIRGFGCSAFMTYGEDGSVLTGRNYDLAHTDRNDEVTGLNVVLRLEPEGKYKSVNMADAAWISQLGLNYEKGALDDGHTPTWPLALLPYLCMDGINEKGLSVSILALDVKDGEAPVHQREAGKKKILPVELLREMLDNCADVSEAIDLAQNCNLINILGHDYHLFVTDAEGTSVVLEWRYNTMQVVYTDAVTNFYTAFDDAEDCLVNGVLKERFVLPDEHIREYHYGYGHGYDRFAVMADVLEEHMTDINTYETRMTEDEVRALLFDLMQDYDHTELTSYTQYSTIYNNTEKSLRVRVRGSEDYVKYYAVEKTAASE